MEKLIVINTDIDKKLKSWDGKIVPHNEWVKLEKELQGQFQYASYPIESGVKISIKRKLFGVESIRVINTSQYDFTTNKTNK